MVHLGCYSSCVSKDLLRFRALAAVSGLNIYDILESCYHGHNPYKQSPGRSLKVRSRRPSSCHPALLPTGNGPLLQCQTSQWRAGAGVLGSPRQGDAARLPEEPAVPGARAPSQPPATHAVSPGTRPPACNCHSLTRPSPEIPAPTAAWWWCPPTCNCHSLTRPSPKTQHPQWFMHTRGPCI
jgi:hypothetical protein